MSEREGRPDKTRAALINAREYVAEALARERELFKGHEKVSSIDLIEQDLAEIDAVINQQESKP